MNEEIRKILEASINAPSGSNSQPWRFEVKSNQIYVIALPEKDHPILNFRNRGTWVAHGALIENIVIASSALGYETNIIIFPDLSNSKLTAIIALKKSQPKRGPLYEAISSRATNRKPYKNISLTVQQKASLAECASLFPSVRLRIIEDRDKINTLGQVGSINEIVTLENKTLHKLFFDEIVWTEKEERMKGGGLYFKTMELKPPQRVALKLFRRWSIMSILNKIGVARGIAKGNAKIYASTPAMGAIIVDDQDEQFLTAGRLMERLWLTATSYGLSFHLITGTYFFYQKIRSGEKELFSEEHRALIESEYMKAASVLNVNKGIIALTFRVGQDDEPSAKSYKNSPVIKFG